METRAAAAKRKANAAAAPLILFPKRHRVALGELLNFSNHLEHTHLEKKTSPNCKILPSLLIYESYDSDIHEYLYEMERKRKHVINYIEKVQRGVTLSMRSILIDWLVEAAREYMLRSDTLFLSVPYIDRFLSVKPMTKSTLQLLGVSVMLIASKYEEIDPPSVDQFCNITDNTCDKEEIDIITPCRLSIGCEIMLSKVKVPLHDLMVPKRSSPMELHSSYEIDP
ncbi:hypothetical protein Fmac_008070 [Flemingia macrophylla]|uniref:B-like cyclin n=1 Tax=Flemingia macrophylla TaxID=520843 RepID=A0ABD1MYR9_9FABA